MKRIAAIVTIAVVVLAMSVGTAFASVCAGGSCEGRGMMCPAVATAACPMKGGLAMTHSSCSHPAQLGTRDILSAQADHSLPAIVSTLAVLPPRSALSGLVYAMPAPDARGAPHLTAVIRI